MSLWLLWQVTNELEMLRGATGAGDSRGWLSRWFHLPMDWEQPLLSLFYASLSKFERTKRDGIGRMGATWDVSGDSWDIYGI